MAAAARWRPLRVLLATLAAVTRNDAQQLIAGIAYYGMVALIPVSVALLQFLGVALGQELSMGWFETWSSRLLPGDIDFESLLVAQDFTVVGITGVFALLGLAWGSYKLFGSVGVVVNRMWGIAPGPGGHRRQNATIPADERDLAGVVAIQRVHLPDFIRIGAPSLTPARS